MSKAQMIEDEIISMFSAIVEEKDIYTSGHSKRVALYSKRIAHALGLDETIQNTIYEAGLLHDIGKILTPESVLLKPRRFNQRELSIIKNHSTDGERILNFISSFKSSSLIVRHHHERFDGKGYPDGLEGNNIPLLSRIMSIADAFDAMTTHRIYKTKKSLNDAITELIKCSGTQFDPDIIHVAIDVLAEVYKDEHMSQYPDNPLQEERFAYFYKDTLTSAYSGEYLNYFLLNNSISHQFQACHFVQIHRMHDYNTHMGWCLGNEVLIEVALRLKFLFHSSFVFRIFGDDFIVLENTPIPFDKKDVIMKLCSGFKGINISVSSFDLVKEPILKWDNLEKYLEHHNSNAS
jgi:putative nucleotidyltransferase with HDIG domain